MHPSTFSIIILSALFGAVISDSKKPNIILIIADDMGWNDVSFHGSDEIPTPNIDALAYNGVILNGHYTQALCTPSRSAMFTGKYPIHTGMQHLVILEPEPWGLPLNYTIMPEYFKKAGYSTHAVGKWHLGFFRSEYTPTYRGFDSHFGYWQGYQGYYDHMVHSTFTGETGYDMRRNMSVDWDAKGKYSTTLFTEEAVKLIQEHDENNPMFMYLAHLAPHTGTPDNPLVAPDEEIAKFAHIEDPERRIYAAMVSMLDDSVGKVVAALRQKHMLENSIIIFMADNGAQTFGVHANHGSNYPLRGMKHSPWDGGVRGVAAIFSPLIQKPQRVSNHMMHMADWLPTLLSAAGLSPQQLGHIDGFDMWKTISQGAESPRTKFVYNIDDIGNYAAIRNGDWKYLEGSTSGGKQDKWYGSVGIEEHYHYDVQAVLSSRAASALAGLITSRQIDEKHNGTTFTAELLNAKKINELREAARLSCGSQKLDETKECRPLEAPCLFNMRDDPCEKFNLANEQPQILEKMKEELEAYRKTAVKINNVERDPNADPKNWNNVWVPWQDNEYISQTKLHPELSGLAIAGLCIICILFVVVIAVLLGINIKKRKSKKEQLYNSYSEDPKEHQSTISMTKDTDQAFEDQEIASRKSLQKMRSIE